MLSYTKNSNAPSCRGRTRLLKKCNSRVSVQCLIQCLIKIKNKNKKQVGRPLVFLLGFGVFLYIQRLYPDSPGSKGNVDGGFVNVLFFEYFHQPQVIGMSHYFGEFIRQ